MLGCIRHVRRRVSFSRLLSYKVAVVGSGPAGFYTTQELLKDPQLRFQVDLFEKAPVPFGLVRYGVAPDHPEVKNCISTFEEIAGQPNVRFLGNVAVGYDVTIAELLRRYHVVVLAYGAGSDNRLGIPGEDAHGCFPSSHFVGWFNGVPEHRHLDPDLSGASVAVVGHGNVALDCARIISAPLPHLAKTDISEHALHRLQQRRTKNVSLFGRRGMLQFQGTIKEVREFTKLSGVHLSVESDNIADVRAIMGSIPRPKKRLTELLLKHSSPKQEQEEGDISVCLKFGWSPVEVQTDTQNKVTGLLLRKNLISGDMMHPTITPTTETLQLPCTCVITSIGYKVIKLPGVPFCERTHRIPEHGSRVLKYPGGPILPGLYTSGWARRGSDGVIATTITDSANTAHSILEDLREGRCSDVSEEEDMVSELENRGVKVVTFDQWNRVDRVEKESGKAKGKPREKLLDYDEILKVK